MVKSFFLRMAATNVKRNARMYVPYFIATVVMSGMCFIIFDLIDAKSIANLSYGETTQSMLMIGAVVMSLFMVAYMFYINSFLIKRRRKEFGLYGVLGLQKRDVSRIILWESLLLNGVGLACGLVFGVLFGKLSLMLLLKAVRTAPNSTFEISATALTTTVVLYLFIFALCTLYNLMQVRLANPIDLLSGDKKGERKPRFMWPMAVVGLLSLGSAYWVAITVVNSGFALVLFWPAVLLVILGTFLLFTAGSAAVLRILRKNKRFYYKPRNFIAIAGLMHRMKQNAAGLANICILSTTVLVTVSACSALYFGQEKMLAEQHARDINVTIGREEAADAFVQEMRVRAKQLDVNVETLLQCHCAYTIRPVGDGVLQDPEDNTLITEDFYSNNEVYMGVYLLPLSDYASVTGDGRTLEANELLVLSEKDYDLAQKQLGGFTIGDRISGTAFTLTRSPQFSTIYLVAADTDACNRFLNAVGYFGGNALEPTIAADFSGDEEKCGELALQLRTWLSDESDSSYSVDDIYTDRLSAYRLYGGLIFIGAMFTLLFLTNTVLIIYFKQVSEGYEDRERFAILQKVGMSAREVKATISRQILIVFFLPLLAALMHVAAATNIMFRIVNAFRMNDMGVMLTCVGATCVVFTAVYLIVFRLTAHSYYSIVRWDSGDPMVSR